EVTSEFLCEGAHFADFNHDGKGDLVAGPYWYAGPDFKQRNEFTPPAPKPYDAAKGYSDFFLTYTYDFNKDGWADILVFSWPGKETAWYENPKGKAGHWFRHVIFAETDNESPTLGDVTGDGKPELIFHTGGRLGYVEADWSDPTKPWTFRPISSEDKKKYFRYTHGYGFGDINGDGKADILDKDGWWEQPKDAKAGGEWKQHTYPFAPAGMRGGAHMLVYDINGDGQNDVVTSWDAHGYGLAWYEQTRTGGDISFKEHVLVNTKPEDNAYGVKFTQIHALTLADVNGDGLMDFVTGKRFWAHGPGKDAEPDAPAVIYWFELKRNGKEASFIPHLVDDDSGVGTQITAGDINGDGLIDVISGNKKGVHVFLQQKAAKK
ncbi:MAG TPA: VCBS repeat-containing protein, partial [Roseimicrobium sp.]|nr:VCBS repeat-containing protein [Roseimicrobium sp.]